MILTIGRSSLGFAIVFALGLVPRLAQGAVIFLTVGNNGTPWTVPANWNTTNNSIQCIGGGAAGRSNINFGDGRSGGGAGAYSAVQNLTLTPGSSIQFIVGAGGTVSMNNPANSGGDTWFNGATLASSSVGAKGGLGTDFTGGAGGAASSGVGTIKLSGGSAPSTGSGAGGGGGGGAAGPNGNGADGLAHAGTAGGAGGNGDAGFGGSGGAQNATGRAGAEFDELHGAGGGGGGGQSGVPGGSGGAYGAGGGGGGGGSNGTHDGGAGGNGLIVITYVPVPGTGLFSGTTVP
jgi:hypothetical protein